MLSATGETVCSRTDTGELALINANSHESKCCKPDDNLNRTHCALLTNRGEPAGVALTKLPRLPPSALLASLQNTSQTIG